MFGCFLINDDSLESCKRFPLHASRTRSENETNDNEEQQASNESKSERKREREEGMICLENFLSLIIQLGRESFTFETRSHQESRDTGRASERAREVEREMK